MHFFESNLTVIHNRWPDIAAQIEQVSFDSSQVELIQDNELSLVFDGIQIASSFDQISEANLQISQLSTNSHVVTLYGTGLGQVQQQLLAKKNLQKLTVYIFNIALFRASLTYFNQLTWLEDVRVKLRLSSLNDRATQPFIALPAELVLAENFSAALRDRACLSLDHDFISRSKGLENIELQQQINRNIDYIVNDESVSELFLSGQKKDYIVCGAGPTLAEHLDYLSLTSTRDKFFVIAVDAAVKPLFDEGIIPDLIVSIDPIAKKLLDFLPLKKFNRTPLIYFPLVKAELLDIWQGNRYVAYSTGTLYDDINIKHPKGRLYCAGSVIHPAIDLSVKMGANRVLLLGADFSFPEGKTHTHWQEPEAKDAVHIASDKTSHWVLNSINEKVPTLLNYRGYLRDLEDYIALTKHVKFYNGSKKGAAIAGTSIWKS